MGSLQLWMVENLVIMMTNLDPWHISNVSRSSYPMGKMCMNVVKMDPGQD